MWESSARGSVEHALEAVQQGPASVNVTLIAAQRACQLLINEQLYVRDDALLGREKQPCLLHDLTAQCVFTRELLEQLGVSRHVRRAGPQVTVERQKSGAGIDCAASLTQRCGQPPQA